MNQHRILPVFVVLLFALAAVGCFVTPMTPNKGQTVTTAAYRFEKEIVGNAQRVRIETQPVWQGGRYAYTAGVDDLLVISRITAWADNVSDEQRKSGDYTRTDRIVERLWITLAPDMEIGRWYDLYDLNKELKIGYDEKPTDMDEFFIRPFGVQGKMMLEEKADGQRVIRLSMRMSPKERTDWTLNETLKLPVVETGQIAKKAAADAPLAAPRIRNKAVDELKDELAQTPVNASSDPAAPGTPGSPGSPGSPGTPGTPGTPGVPGTPGGTDPATATQQATPGAELSETQKLADSNRERIMGQWQGDTGVYEMRLQFKEDDTFVYSSSRSGFAPGMKYGTWEIRGNLLVMQVKRFEFDGRNHMRFMRDPYIILQIRWLADKLSLYGDYKDREGAQGNMRVDFAKDEFADMDQTVPPARP